MRKNLFPILVFATAIIGGLGGIFHNEIMSFREDVSPSYRRNVTRHIMHTESDRIMNELFLVSYDNVFTSWPCGNTIRVEERVFNCNVKKVGYGFKLTLSYFGKTDYRRSAEELLREYPIAQLVREQAIDSLPIIHFVTDSMKGDTSCSQDSTLQTSSTKRIENRCSSQELGSSIPSTCERAS